MSNLTDILPQKSKTVEAIEAHWKRWGDSQSKRGYLGGSEIGHQCRRYLWYKFRDCVEVKFDGRLYRLFNRGHREEVILIGELRAIGCEVQEGPEPGKQFGVEAVNGHFRGHADGVAIGVPEAPKTWHLLEFKTASEKKFNELKKLGSIVKWNAQYFAQVQVYMQLLQLDRCLFLVVNKNTDELYSERIERNAEAAKTLLDRAESIIKSTTPPDRIADRPDDFRCKFCSAHALCWGQGESLVPVPELSCRQCCHASPIEGGKWSCAVGREYGKPCERHLMLPGLVDGYEPSDALKNEDGSDVIEFRSDDGSVFHHGPNGNAGQYSSHDLITLPRSMVALPWTPPIKEDGKVMIDLVARYSGEGCSREWYGKASDLGAEMDKRGMKEPIATANGEGWQGAEYKENLCAFVWSDGNAEIREGVPY